MNRRRIIAATLTAATLTGLTGCASASTPPDMIALHYAGGDLSAKKFVDCLDPSSRSGYDPGDTYVGYPTRQVSFDATGSFGAESEAFSVVSQDNAEMRVPVTVTFRLKTDCDTLRKMHETIGSRYNAGFDTDADSGTGQSNRGWVSMLRYVIGKPLDSALDRKAQQYGWRKLWNDPAVKTALERDVNGSIAALVARQAGGEFFDDFSVLIQKPDPTEAGLKDAIALEQVAVAKANAAEKQAAADVRAADAQVAVAKAKALSKRQEVEAYRLKGMTSAEAIRAYNEAQMIEKGLNPRQPTYLVNSTR